MNLVDPRFICFLLSLPTLDMPLYSPSENPIIDYWALKIIMLRRTTLPSCNLAMCNIHLGMMRKINMRIRSRTLTRHCNLRYILLLKANTKWKQQLVVSISEGIGQKTNFKSWFFQTKEMLGKKYQCLQSLIWLILRNSNVFHNKDINVTKCYLKVWQHLVITLSQGQILWHVVKQLIWSKSHHVG